MASLSNTRKSERIENPSPAKKKSEKIEKSMGPSPLRRSDRGKTLIDIPDLPNIKSKKENSNEEKEYSGLKRKRFIAQCYKAIFKPLRIRIESDDDKDPEGEDKSPQNNDDVDDESVRTRRKIVNNTLEPAQLKPETEGVNEGVTEGVNEGKRAILEYGLPVGDDFWSTAVGNNETSLHDLLKPTASELCKVLKFSEDMKIIVDKFLKFVLENYHVSKEHTSTLQAFMISLCWISSSLSKNKINRSESFAIAKKHFNFSCVFEEANSVYSKLKPAKETFLQHTEILDALKDSSRKFQEDIETTVNLEKIKKLGNEILNETHVKDLKSTVLAVEGQLAAEVDPTLSGSSIEKQCDSENVQDNNVREGDGADVAIGDIAVQEHDDVAGDDATVLNEPIPAEEFPGQQHDDMDADVAGNETGLADVSPHVDSGETEMPAGNCNEENAVEDCNKTASNDAAVHVDSDEMATPAGGCSDNISLDTSEAGSNPPCADASRDNTPSVVFLVSDQINCLLPDEVNIDNLQPLDSGQDGQNIPEDSSDAPAQLVNGEIPTQNNSRPELDMFDNVNQTGSRMPNYIDPIQVEVERLCLAKGAVIKYYEETKQRIKSDCEKEIAEMIVQISLKYEAERQDAEVAFHSKKKEIETVLDKVVMNKILANVFRSKCQDLTPFGHAGMQQASQAGLMQQLHRFSRPPFTRCFPNVPSSPGQSSGSRHTPPPLPPPPPPPQPSLQIVHQTAALFSTPPPNNHLRPPSTSPIIPTINRPPPVLNYPNTNSNNLRPPLGNNPVTPSTTPTTTRPPPDHNPNTPSNNLRLPPVHNPLTPSTTPTTNRLPPGHNSVTHSTTPTTNRPPPGINPNTPSNNLRPPPGDNPITPSTTPTTNRLPPGHNPYTPLNNLRPPPGDNPNTPSITPNKSPPTINSIDGSTANLRTHTKTRDQPPHIRPVTNSEIRAPAPHMRKSVTNEIRGPAPHIRPFKSTSSVPSDLATYRRMLPRQHVTNSQSSVLPATSSSLPHSSSHAPSPRVTSIPTRRWPALASSDNLNSLMDNAARWVNILTPPSDFRSKFDQSDLTDDLVCLSDDD